MQVFQVMLLIGALVMLGICLSRLGRVEHAVTLLLPDEVRIQELTGQLSRAKEALAASMRTKKGKRWHEGRS